VALAFVDAVLTQLAPTVNETALQGLSLAGACAFEAKAHKQAQTKDKKIAMKEHDKE
jgi:hypothetical protein